MSKAEGIIKGIAVVTVLVLVTVGGKQLIKDMDAHDTQVKETSGELYIPVPKAFNNKGGYYVCSKYMETQITSPNFECFGTLYSCHGMPVVKCADGTTYFNPTDLKLDGARLLNHNQMFPLR